MIATRRLGRARHEFRFGTREIAVLGAAFCFVAGLVFAGGVLVGREMGRKNMTRTSGARELGRGDADPGRAEAPAKSAATRTEERVTFYRTLTAPTPDLPQVGKPTIEEHLVPKDDPAPPPAPAVTPAAASPAATAVTPSTAHVATVPPTEAVSETPEVTEPTPPRPAPRGPAPARPARPVRAAKAPTVSAVPTARPAPAQLAAAPAQMHAPAEPDSWTVQVSAFRSRALAEELRSRLAARGYDATVFPSITEDGRPRYRVRVGAYVSRGEAERAAGELRSERGLNPLVTPRTTR